ncbi:hypothetical protein L873DRAFT_1895252 [Choiromyces venosus 120613-1]|uniref:Uncharacterized protein n=1 Tax=Choiromyces venosus 120613-1 TaxID=1336337 RepID=A0A3N4JRC6_9PEZI|nr:hypothetical protein L873DRAFT_1895252 [Choiromyces venosus 120613-1]
MSDEQSMTATGSTPLLLPHLPTTPPTTASYPSTAAGGSQPVTPIQLSRLSKTFSKLELEIAHHENTLYNIQTTLTTLLPVTQQTTLNILGSIENAAEELWSLKQQYERANVALLRLRLDDIRVTTTATATSEGDDEAEQEEIDTELNQMKKTSEMLSKSLKWADEFRLDLGRRTDAVYFAAGDLEGIEVGDGDGELEVVGSGRSGLGVVCADSAAAALSAFAAQGGGRSRGGIWVNAESDLTSGEWGVDGNDEWFWGQGENTATLI